MDEELKIIKETICEILKTMDFSAEVALDDDSGNLVVNINTEEAGFLIGQGGENLFALQYLSRVLLSKKMQKLTPFVIDVNDYRKHRVELLKELAKKMAEESLLEKRDVTLEPMSSYERRVVHMALADYEGIKTESIGEGGDRRVVIRLV